MYKHNNPGNSCTTTELPSKKYQSKTKKTHRTLLEKQGRTHKWRSSMDPFPVLAEEQEFV